MAPCRRPLRVVEASESPGDSSLGLGALLRTALASPEGFPALAPHQARVLHLLAKCHTGDLGMACWLCEHCKDYHWTPRACRNRACPGCQASESHRWLVRQQQALLPVAYHHVVFTLPSELHPLARSYPKLIYGLLLDTAAKTLLEFGRSRFGGDIGATGVLHTWGQMLQLHPHAHFIVAAGALSPDKKRWTPAPRKSGLFPVRALSVHFRAEFLSRLAALAAEGQFQESLPEMRPLLGALHRKKWNVFSRPPFGGPESVLRYLANYTHRIAISDRRIRRINTGSNTVTFAYRDYADNSRSKEMTLPIDAFIRRFAQHILPSGLHRIRHYGLLANNRRKRDIARIRELLEVPAPPAESPSVVERLCPNCGQGPLRCVAITDSVGRIKIFPGKVPILDSS